ncbi:hypothetical protein EXE59_09770 [Nocardioides eburneiflavus]|uniref:Uncharacterized protein n=1 Tax=Nocardioides eburneiflavus TaxID=2518372 RepID=A0A4Z1CA03_9ACTN|nr:hypothetical protein [Nocardioides eburneiflavus]TGN64206.1 hypothetical protein EXE59_09770 [Nocardioides eburneiflavus]
MCRGPKNSPKYRRCLSSIPASQGGTRDLSKAVAAEVRRAIAAGEALDPRDDLGAAISRAEADAAAHEAWLASEPTALEIELSRVGLAGLDSRYGFGHSVHLRPADLDALDVPGVEPAPSLPADAGVLDGVTLTAPPSGGVWTPLTGLTLLWTGVGDHLTRETYAARLGAWFTDFFEALRQRGI